MKLKHVDLTVGSVFQDAREVQTKFSKSFTTYFFPVGNDVRQIVDAWVTYLRREKLWGNDDPLFPATLVELGKAQQFEAVGLAKKHWSTASPIRAIFRGAFESAGLPYFNPHSFRTTLVQLGQTLCRDAEQFKAWSQNLGHEGGVDHVFELRSRRAASARSDHPDAGAGIFFAEWSGESNGAGSSASHAGRRFARRSGMTDQSGAPHRGTRWVKPPADPSRLSY